MSRHRDRLRGVLGLLACLALAVVIAVVVPDPDTAARRRWSSATVGGVAATDTVSARVDQVQVTRAVRSPYGEDWNSDQTLVVVTLEVSVRREVVQFSAVAVQTTDGPAYEPRSEFASAALAQTQPGFTRRSTLVFELPPDRVPGAALVIDPDGAAVDIYARAIRINLGLRSPVSVAAGPVPLPETTVRVT